MKKNGQYVGVDDKYIPEEEKYVDNSLNDEVKGLVNDGIRSAKDYLSQKDNQEKIKNAGRKGLKIFKGIGIGYLCFIGFIILMFIVVLVFMFSTFFKIDKQFDKTTNIIDNVTDSFDKSNSSEISSYDISTFNNDLEIYQGTKYGSSVLGLLDNVVTKIKKNNIHSITVTYGTFTVSNVDDIISLKKEFDDMARYEISFEYDSDGFINKVSIVNY